MGTNVRPTDEQDFHLAELATATAQDQSKQSVIDYLIGEKFQSLYARQVAHGHLDDISAQRSVLLRRLSTA